MHSPREVERVLALVAEGWNDCRISRATGISRRTVNNWRHGRLPKGRSRSASFVACPLCGDAPLDEPAYSYLLGLYLGDGHIVRYPRTFRLCISQDQRYPALIDLAAATMRRVHPSGSDYIANRIGCVEINAYWQHWPCLFPQHGPGKKHERRIVLTGWQQAIVDRYPRQLLRGLIHSDGCRSVNRVHGEKYEYPRYFFTNHSEDIREIFRDTCSAIGIEPRACTWKLLSVARRAQVATLDTFIGPKS